MFSKLFVIAAALQACLAAPHGAKHHQHPQLNTTEPLVARAGLGNAIINNRCSYDVWMWPVNQNYAGSAIKIAAGSQHSAPALACENCGTSMKISKTSTLTSGAQTQFEYTFGGGMVWYDISFVDCAKGNDASSCPGHSEGLVMAASDSSCPTASCSAGAYCPEKIYYVDQPLLKLGIAEPTFACSQGVDVVSTLC
ncbi:hypothetical protein B0J11DRAFT_148649 [Dendryphion nanum]|uniref:Thaumatin-like protein n=1 Tax=Dendryphion nanum TaxID=256645 RepID=A0A9P9ED53_9PLEO|nr:hypothetical protein B0J11DRAFT_148649 [Dendryphion nanum]